MLSVILIFLFAALWLYALLGGADFGAGILEAISPKTKSLPVRNMVYKAIGPVWEANHIWLILIIVILFVAFPQAYHLISVYLHIPLMLMLVGIILRGTAFVFRHYDAMKDDAQEVYSRLFRYGSFISPMLLGMIAGACMLGRMEASPTSFYASYLAPWMNGFCLMVGLFFVGISTFSAAVFLLGEVQNDSLKNLLRKQAWYATFYLLLVGFGIFISAEFYEFHMAALYLDSWPAILSLVGAACLFPLIWFNIRQNQHFWARVFCGLMVALILIGWLSIQFPYLLLLPSGGLNVWEIAAPDAVLNSMAWTLIGGSFLIFPAIYYLFRVFKWSDK